MEVSSQEPFLMAMDLSKSYSVNSLTHSHTEVMDLAKKPEWYHRRLPSCSTEISSSYGSRSSSSYNSLSSQLCPEAGAPVLCRDIEQGPEALGNYMSSALAPGLDLYHNTVHSNLWHPGFYGADQSGGIRPESSGGEESDSGSDVIVLVSSAKEPLLCSSFIQDSMRHIVEPLSPAVSSLDEGRGCYHLPQPLSSPSPDSSYSEDSSDSSMDIPVHHTRPVVLLSDLSAVYGNPADSLVDISSDDSDIIEVSVTNEKKNALPCKKSHVRESPPQSDDKKAPAREVRRSTRIRNSVSEMPQFNCKGSRHSLRRQVKNNTVGIYNECCDSDDMMEYAVRVSSPDADKLVSLPNVSQRGSSNSDDSDVEARTEKKSPPKPPKPSCKPLYVENINHKQKNPLAIHKTKRVRRSKQKQNLRPPPKQHQNAATGSNLAANKTRRKKKRRSQTGPSAPFFPREPEIMLKYAKVKMEKQDYKLEHFRPFVHVEQRACTVVNYREEEVSIRSHRGKQQLAARSLSGLVPNTSCFQMGRLSSESRCRATLLCCMCGQVANATGLGDLHGPYRPTSPFMYCQQKQETCRTVQKEEEHIPGLANRHSVNSSADGCEYNCSAVKSLLENDTSSLPTVPLRLDECWIHEDCGIWSAGVFLVRGKLYGLEEAARLAKETTCSTCQQTGAIMGCFQKGCLKNYHYRCAIQSGCVLNEDNFSMRCPEHKNKLFTSITRQHKR